MIQIKQTVMVLTNQALGIYGGDLEPLLDTSLVCLLSLRRTYGIPLTYSHSFCYTDKRQLVSFQVHSNHAYTMQHLLYLLFTYTETIE